MSNKYIKLEDAIRKYAEMIADEAYWEHGVGNGKPDEEDLDIAREYYSDLPTIDIVRCKECKHINKSQCITNLDGTEKRYKCDCNGDYMLERNFCSFGERIDNE